MANLRELNQQNPFWDWVSEIERQNRSRNDNGEGSSQRATPGQQEENNNEKEKPDEDLPDWDDEKTQPPPGFDEHPQPPPFDGTSPPPPPPPGFDGPRGPQGPHHHPHHHSPERRRGGGHRRGGHFGPRGGHGHHRGGHHGGPWQHGFGGWGSGPTAFGFGPHMFGGERERGRHGNRGWDKMFGRGGFDMDKLGQMLKANLGFNPIGNTRGPQDDEKDFTPAVDVFDTTQAYYIHMSLAGAKKQDLDVSWDAENFQVIVSGIIHRPGDEEFLKTLAVDERDIGVFERKIKLGTRADPVNVDADGISAKMEDGVLMIKVPKHEEFIEIKKVDIE